MTCQRAEDAGSAMDDVDLLQGLRYFLIVGVSLASIGTLLYAYYQTKAVPNLPQPKHRHALLLCGIALSAVLAIMLFRVDTRIIHRQEHAIMLLESSIESAELKAKGPLSDNKRAILSTAIRTFAGTEYDVAAAPCADSNLIVKLNSALSAGQWKLVGTYLPATAASPDDPIRIQYSQNSKSAVDTLTAAMKAAGLDATAVLDDTKSADTGPNIVHIFIGPKSQ
jgi:type II secretory pathway pseudopilin PulG